MFFHIYTNIKDPIGAFWAAIFIGKQSEKEYLLKMFRLYMHRKGMTIVTADIFIHFTKILLVEHQRDAWFSSGCHLLTINDLLNLFSLNEKLFPRLNMFPGTLRLVTW